MQQLARAVGFLYLGSGLFLMAFPKPARGVIQARAEIARLSPGALRILGAGYAIGGALLVAVTAMPAIEAVTAKGVSRELPKVA